MTRYKFSRTAAGIAGALALTLGLLSACSTSDFLKVTSPSRIPASSLEDPANAALLVNGAVADFECAFGAYVVAGGLIGQELEDATLTADRYPYDQRRMLSSSARYATYSCTSIGTYSPLQTARVSADNIRRLLTGWTDAEVPNRQRLIAKAAAYEAYAQLLLGEGFCSTVFSTFNTDGSVSYGTEITPTAAFDSAITHFTEAIAAAQAAAPGDTAAQSVLYMAYAGRARAELDKGDLAAAKSDAAQVPAGFVYEMTASDISSRRWNRVWADNGVNGSSYNLASTVESYYRKLNDPRVPVDTALSPPNQNGVVMFVQMKYAKSSSPIPIASYTEAQLIIAEADIGTDNASAETILNASRADGNEPPLAAGADAATLKDALIEERRRALFLEGQHLYDLIRFQIPLNPADGATYPGGGTYGSQLCMPLPDIEKFNNPALGGGV